MLAGLDENGCRIRIFTAKLTGTRAAIVTPDVNKPVSGVEGWWRDLARVLIAYCLLLLLLTLAPSHFCPAAHAC